MKRGLNTTLLGLLALAGLLATLRQDLGSLALHLGTARLQSGDPGGAETAFRWATTLGRDAAPLAYNLGVSLYRQGDFTGAQQQFAAALATAGRDLSPAIHYNRGNSEFRRGELLAASQPQAARSLLREAVADYGQALAQAPDAADAGSNLAVARLRLAALGAEASSDDKRPRAGTEDKQGTPDGRGNKAEGERTKADAKSASRQMAADAGEERRADSSAGRAKPRVDLTQPEVERLLNDARGREKPAGTLHAGNHAGKLAQPDKDW